MPELGKDGVGVFCLTAYGRNMLPPGYRIKEWVVAKLSKLGSKSLKLVAREFLIGKRQHMVFKPGLTNGFNGVSAKCQGKIKTGDFSATGLAAWVDLKINSI